MDGRGKGTAGLKRGYTHNMDGRKVLLVVWGRTHKPWMGERKVQLVECGPYTKHGWKRERYGCLNGDHIHNMDGSDKGTAG